ncbi:hypothetical protein PTKIN_Ptkin02bG0076000 [Pterospermum kingtungense]
MMELEVLQLLGKYDRNGSRCVQLWNWFDYRNHICIVFEMLGPSLYHFLWKNNYRLFPVDLVRELGRQLLECVAFMHDLCLIHTDLKPENILFVSSEYVKIPDKVSSRSSVGRTCYRRLPKSSAIKDWAGVSHVTYGVLVVSWWNCAQYDYCFEVYFCDFHMLDGKNWHKYGLLQGEALFQTHENLEHLAMMERILGPLSQHMLKRVDWHAEKYVRKGRLDWPEGATSRESIKAVMKLPRLQNLVMQHVDHSGGDLIDLLQGLLSFDRCRRLTAREALRHHFFT